MVESNNSSTLVGYERVKQILNEIQGDTVPEYQGYRAFWLSLDTFKTAVLYGQKMIAPEQEEGAPSYTGHAPEGGGAAGEGRSCCNKDKELGKDNGDGGSAVEAVNTQPTVPGDTNCWPTGGSGGAGVGGSGTKRSDQSGIIIGLRGEAPFDGSNFPPLLWDANRRATAQEIQLIAQWIDDGCQDSSDLKREASSNSEGNVGNNSTNNVNDNRVIRVSQRLEEKRALACGDKKHRASDKCTNVERQGINGLGVRKEISTLTPKELTRFRDALQCMYQYNAFWQDERSFDHWARIHTDSCQHGWEQFLPWHRLYLYFFEQTLQDYDPYITLPYWSWTDYSVQNATTFNNTELDIGVIPEAYHCWLSDKGLKALENAKDNQGKNVFDEKELNGLRSVEAKGKTYNSGLRFLNAAGISYSLIKDPKTGTAAWADKIRIIYNVLRDTNPLWFPNRWPGAIAGGPTAYPTQSNINNILNLSNWSDFGGGPEYDHHFGALEQVHNGMHNFSGGSNPTSPANSAHWKKIYQDLGIPQADPQNRENPPTGWMTDNRITAFDPIFWGHHCNVDRIWSRWQEMHPDTKPEEVDGVLAPWSMSIKDSLSIKKLGYEYQRDSVHYSTASDVAITKFNSDPAGVRQSVLDTFRKAEVRVHRVQRGNMQNCTVRLFLNAPEADVTTSTEDNANFIGEFSTFHGTCYGGPGHCDLPLPKTRGNDQRRLHHHEPRNYRIDATDSVNAMLKNGDNDLSVQMVVVGANGQPMDNALYMDGVSLNFLD